jgi:alkylhydroperoxidase family enzyme
VSRAYGISEEQLLGLRRYETSDLFSPLERLVIDLAVAMTSTPAEVSDELRSALREQLSAAQFTELASAIAWENHRARLNRALAVRPAGFSDGAFCLLPEAATRPYE